MRINLLSVVVCFIVSSFAWNIFYSIIKRISKIPVKRESSLFTYSRSKKWRMRTPRDEIGLSLEKEINDNCAYVEFTSVIERNRCFFDTIEQSATFKEFFFESRPFLIESLDKLDSLGDVNSFIKQINERNHSLPILTDELVNTAKIHSFSPEQVPSPRESEAAWFESIAQRTLVENNAEAFHKNISQLVSVAQSALFLPTSANMYISSAENFVTSPLHTDRMNSYILQFQGKKRWRVFTPSTAINRPVLDANVLERGKYGDVLTLDEIGPILLDETLDAETGDIVYLPRGFPHATSTWQTVVDADVNVDSSTHTHPSYSVSLTMSPLTESVGLTYDKILRCFAGHKAGCKAGEPCEDPERILRATPQLEDLRESVWFPKEVDLDFETILNKVRLLAYEISALDGKPNLDLPSENTQKKMMKHMYVKLRKVLNETEDALVTAGFTVSEDISQDAQTRTKYLGSVYKKVFPKSCRIFVEPAKVLKSLI